MKDNGQPKPAITIFWDNETQCYAYNVDSEQLKNPDMVAAVLGICHDHAKFNVNATNAQRLQQKLMLAAQEQAIRQQIIKH
jgi:hypothetical protein